ncbi:hypothetical protein GLOTRDRAFT_127341 [Gloeophyllum trabeum ATCC 11539]|uniref:Cleavage/polyadenylation specificity factor A subunit N-terminal domain-containing protein n=1 Tax=Gloeophyllum trabeum (strain ATCC 11539 / FP-39264 / Madison 617) TaxID=670483 RepID=S7QAL1_GLOTA|nr:uncharacterized protein GLOTRDRAFT_127341 [Gloeophyllum trabeum ATCC 11539]EPQ56956.1 hypothetical protein GLOTRDRAFT_127341 [Gloeophyllum trabeum ATCC 11539]
MLSAAASSTTETLETNFAAVHFVAGEDGEYLITVSGSQYRSTVSCWEVPLRGSQAFCVAQLEDQASHYLFELVCNEDPDSQGTFCLQTNLEVPSLRVYSLDKFHGRFVALSVDVPVIPDASVLLLRGNFILFDNLQVYDWKMDRLLSLSISSDDPDVEDLVLGAKYINGYFLIVRRHSGVLVKAPNPTSPAVQGDPGLIIHWDFHAIQTAIYVQDPFYRDQTTGWPKVPITILLRGFEVIKQVDLLATVPSTAGPSRDTNDTPEAGVALHVINNRLIPIVPSHAEMLVGPSGKGIWLETRNITRKHATYPARCIVGFSVRREHDEEACASAAYQPPGNVVEMCKSEVFVQRLGSCELARRRYGLGCVAFEDTVGRIAFIGRDGTLQILDYA